MDVKENSLISIEDEKSHWWIRTRFFFLKTLLLRVVKRNKISLASLDVLEIGCGTAQNLDYVARNPNLKRYVKSLTGVEPNWNDSIPKRNEIVIYKKLSELGNKKFDVIIAFDVIEHIEQDEQELVVWHHMLNENGYLLVTVPAYMWLWSYQDDFDLHQKRYTKSTLRSVTTNAGFLTERVSYFFAHILPIMVVVRKLLPKIASSSCQKKQTDFKKENKIVNFVLTAMGWIEHTTGGNPILGASVIGVFKKRNQTRKANRKTS